MLRFPNPGSDMPTFVRIFQSLYTDLNAAETFTLDDMSLALIRRNLASSCGHVGEEALRRSTREDRSRDPLYNQSKMYSELYRTLGWMSPQPEDKLKFNFTYLGAHVAEAQHDVNALVRECVLGIAYPNEVVEVKTDAHIRPFGCILRSMLALNGLLFRDEMIIGPLCSEDDRAEKDFIEMIAKIKSVRGSCKRLLSEIAL